MKTIFIHIIDPVKYNSIIELCSKLDIKTESVTNRDLERTVLDIISQDNIKVNKGIKPANGMFLSKDNTASLSIPLMYNMPEVMIFKGFDETELKSFLTEYKSAGIEKVTLKAMVTPYNIVWTLYDLIVHLKEENVRLG